MNGGFPPHSPLVAAICDRLSGAAHLILHFPQELSGFRLTRMA